MKSILINILFYFTFTSTLYAQVEIELDSKKQSIYPLPRIIKPTDFSPLKDLLSSKKIIALGESTHAAKEFFQLKCQLIKFLIDSCGYKTLTLETPFLSSLYINDYIIKGKGNIDSAMKMLESWIFYTPEFKDLLLWIREFNKTKQKNEQVNIYGLDIHSVTNFTTFLSSTLNENTSAAKTKLVEILNSINSPHIIPPLRLTNNLSAKDYQMLLSASNLLKEWILKYEGDIKDSHPQESLQLIKTAINTFEYVINTPNQAYSYRDSCMAQIFSQVSLLRPESKSIVWAHNQHISTYDSLVKYPIYDNTLGNYINKKYKSLYYPIGLIFNKGSFTALEPIKNSKTIIYPHLKVNYLESLKDNSLPVKFSESGYPIFFTDIETSKNEIFKKYSKIYTVGSIYASKSPTNTLYITPYFSFKGLLFVDSINYAQQIDNFYYNIIK